MAPPSACDFTGVSLHDAPFLFDPRGLSERGSPEFGDLACFDLDLLRVWTNAHCQTPTTCVSNSPWCHAVALHLLPVFMERRPPRYGS